MLEVRCGGRTITGGTGHAVVCGRIHTGGSARPVPRTHFQIFSEKLPAGRFQARRRTCGIRTETGGRCRMNREAGPGQAGPGSRCAPDYGLTFACAFHPDLGGVHPDPETSGSAEARLCRRFHHIPHIPHDLAQCPTPGICMRFATPSGKSTPPPSLSQVVTAAYVFFCSAAPITVVKIIDVKGFLVACAILWV